MPRELIRERVDTILELMGLTKFRSAYPRELSVSAEQRIIIGRSFAMQPDLLLMDEPYGQMDVKVRFYLAERVLILSNKPATVKEEVIIDLPRPRKVSDPEFIKYRNYITEKIKWW